MTLHHRTDAGVKRVKAAKRAQVKPNSFLSNNHWISRCLALASNCDIDTLSDVSPFVETFFWLVVSGFRPTQKTTK